MPSIYTGLPGNVSHSLSRTVSAATNATPIVITTTADHLFATGDTVIVASVAGNTAANGTWTITKVSATTFSLDTSVGSGAYTSGGTAVDVSLTPQFQIPSDGDGPFIKAADVAVGFEALADRDQHLNARIRSFEDRLKLVDFQRAAGGSLGVSLANAGTLTQTVPLLSAGIATVVGDVVEVVLSVDAGMTLAGTNASALTGVLEANQNGGGSAPISGSFRAFRPHQVNGSIGQAEMSLVGTFVVASAGTLAINSVWILALAGNVGDTAFVSSYTALLKIWRP